MEKSRGKYGRDQSRMRQELDSHKKMMQPSTKNIKALYLWIFFLIYCSTFFISTKCETYT